MERNIYMLNKICKIEINLNKMYIYKTRFFDFVFDLR